MSADAEARAVELVAVALEAGRSLEARAPSGVRVVAGRCRPAPALGWSHRGRTVGDHSQEVTGSARDVASWLVRVIGAEAAARAAEPEPGPGPLGSR